MYHILSRHNLLQDKVGIINLSSGHISGVAYYGRLIGCFKKFRECISVRVDYEINNSIEKHTKSSKRKLISASRRSSGNSLTNEGNCNRVQQSSFSRSQSSPNVAQNMLDVQDRAVNGNSFSINPSSRLGASTTGLSLGYEPIRTARSNASVRSKLFSGSRNISSELHSARSLSELQQSVADTQRSSKGSVVRRYRGPNKDVVLQTFLQSQLVRIGLRIYLYFHVCGNSDVTPDNLMKILNVKEKNDRQIIEYLTSIVSRQLDLADVNVEYLP